MDTRVDLHPMSPLGLTRTGRAPFLLLLNRRYMMASTRAWLSYPGLSFPSRNTSPTPRRTPTPSLGFAQPLNT
jgi:hypothetical protein